ncbi:M48 family metalloprotease [Candidatus Woesearchaeota archaeon]|nr:M48 family metalloprotease [Candidatus Woesearchaeota archaeon]
MNKTSFYDEIRSNKLKTTLLIILFSILLLFIGYVVGIIFFNNALLGLILAFFISFVLIMFSYFNGDSIVLKVSRAVEAKKPQYTYLINTVEGLAIAAGIPKPKVWVINDENPNAFATGRNPENSHVAVTTGLLNLMNREELEGVIAHELSHIKNYDIRYMMIVGVMVGMAVIISDFVFYGSLFGGGRNDRDGGNAVVLVIGIILAVLAPLIAELIKLAISRKREFLADASGAKLTRNPNGLANALKKLRDYKGPALRGASKATSHLFISNPFKKTDFFSTHPDINSRIQKLENM